MNPRFKRFWSAYLGWMRIVGMVFGMMLAGAGLAALGIWLDDRTGHSWISLALLIAVILVMFAIISWKESRE